jgi:hypothetical protein
MKELRYTLVSDGSSDRLLMPILTWLLRKNLMDWEIQEKWAELRILPKPPQKLWEKISKAIELYPCDLLFVHRDAEKEPRENRETEIMEALEEARLKGNIVSIPAVCVVPVRMQEAWLLFHEKAIRKASGNPNGRVTLRLPPLSKLEQLPDPKEELHWLLREASELNGRRLQKLNISQIAYRLADFIEDFAPLRKLNAFRALEANLSSIVKQQRWLTKANS